MIPIDYKLFEVLSSFDEGEFCWDALVSDTCKLLRHLFFFIIIIRYIQTKEIN